MQATHANHRHDKVLHVLWMLSEGNVLHEIDVVTRFKRIGGNGEERSLLVYVRSARNPNNEFVGAGVQNVLHERDNNVIVAMKVLMVAFTIPCCRNRCQKRLIRGERERQHSFA